VVLGVFPSSREMDLHEKLLFDSHVGYEFLNDILTIRHLQIDVHL